LAIHLVRHAKAGDRERWTRPDTERPLTRSGLRQAEGLVRRLAAEPVERILSSPYVRCVQTVEPLAAARGLPVELADRLAEAAGLAGVLELAREAGAQTAVFCSHGDVIWETLEHLKRLGLVEAAEDRVQKGSTWVIETDGRRWLGARYLPPP
jgi:8-oxo-dGTP diphosphatase